MSKELANKVEDILSKLGQDSSPWVATLIKTAQNKNVDISEWNTLILKLSQISADINTVVDAMKTISYDVLDSSAIEEAVEPLESRFETVEDLVDTLSGTVGTLDAAVEALNATVETLKTSPKIELYRHDIALWIISRETDDCGGVVESTKGMVRFTFTNSGPTPYNVDRGNLIPYDAINSYTGVATGFHTALSDGLAHIHLYKLSNNKTHVTMISPKNVYYDVTLDYSVPNFYIQDTVRKVTS